MPKAEPGADVLEGWYDYQGALEYRARICPRWSIKPATAELLRLHGFWQQRILPLAGGLFDQPHMIVQAMPIIDRCMADATKTKD